MKTTDPRASLNPDSEPDHEPPCWEWDMWEREVIERGMSKEMACLGRAVIREAGQHGWCPQLCRLCSEEVLEEVLLKAPDLAKRLCEVLLETDGLRFAIAEGEAGNGELFELAGFESNVW